MLQKGHNNSQIPCDFVPEKAYRELPTWPWENIQKAADYFYIFADFYASNEGLETTINFSPNSWWNQVRRRNLKPKNELFNPSAEGTTVCHFNTQNF